MSQLKSNNTGLRCLAALLACLLFFSLLPASAADMGAETARPSANGSLHVEGTGLADASGRPVQLRGVSTHGLTWFPDYLNETLFGQISADWNCNLIRLAMYSEL